MSFSPLYNNLSNASNFQPMVMPPIAELSELEVSAEEQMRLTLDGENIKFDESLTPIHQARDVFRQMKREVPDAIYQQHPQNDPIDIQGSARSLTLKNKRASDKYEEVRVLRANKKIQKIEDGRPHIKQLAETIDNIHSNYQKKYGELVKNATQYMHDMNTLASKLSRYMEAGSDGKIHFAKEGLLRAMDSIVSKYSGTSVKIEVDLVTPQIEALEKRQEELSLTSGNDMEKAGIVAKIIDLKAILALAVKRKGEGAYFGEWEPKLKYATPLMVVKGSEKEYEFWERKLSGQGFELVKDNGELRIYPDLKPVKEIFYAINHSSGAWNDGSDIAPQEFQSLQSAVDSQKNTINSSVSRLLETFRQDNSHFDTLTQLLIQLYKDLQQYNVAYINSI